MNDDVCDDPVMRSTIALSGNERTPTPAIPMVTGWRAGLATARVWAAVLRLALAVHSPGRALRVVLALYRKVCAAWPDERRGLTPKLVRGAGRYFFHLNYPGYPSPAFDRFVTRELVNMASPSEGPANLQTLILSITRRCPLSCQHCSEWKTLDGRERLSRQDLVAITRRFEALGVHQVLLTGGEPLLRLDDVVALCRASHAETDYWIATSGFRLDGSVAARLTDAGLTGVYISMDHFEADRHDLFRGRVGSYRQVVQAARHVRDAGLVLCLTLCATRDFVSVQNLERYARLAAELGAGFVQILEPRPVGRYEGRDVALSRTQLALLEEFKMSVNVELGRAHLPKVVYHGDYQRRLGCYGAGKRYVFVDNSGEVHACPFCPDSVGNCLDDSLTEVLERVERSGCHTYQPGRY